jgi:tRNA modification GTPase
MRQRHGPKTTIVACATALGRGAIAIIRLSGPAAKSVVNSLAGTLPAPRRLTLQTYRDPSGETIDEGLTAWFPGPGSFTGEDCVEFQVHGGPAVIDAMMTACLTHPEVRLADPGEFTRRAVINGRLDLAQAEALADLIDAETQAQRRQAFSLMQGQLGERVRSWRQAFIRASVLLEAQIDFSDEGDVDSSTERQVLTLIEPALADIEHELAQAKQSIRIRNGFTIALSGPPNAGKSTLINALAKRDVSLVSSYRGTTRDAIEARCAIAGQMVTFIDLAGLRETSDPVELMGVERARDRMKEADLVLWLSPWDEPQQPPDGLQCLMVRTKSDMAGANVAPSSDTIVISAQTGANLPALLEEIAARLRLSDMTDGLVSRERQQALLSDVRHALIRAKDQVERPELAAEDLRIALDRLGRVTDAVANEEILDHLFSNFCIGK